MVEVDFEIEQPRGRRVWRAVKWPVLLLGIPLFWFFGITKTDTIEWCPVCGHETDVLQYRVLDIPVSTDRKETLKLLEKILCDLGRPCPHENSEPVWCYRYWGTKFCFQCTLRLTGSSDYDTTGRRLVLQYAQDHPEAVDEMWRRVRSGDRERVWEYYRLMRGSQDDSSATGGAED